VGFSGARVRIIAGEFKGRKLETPPRAAAHVMGERERAAVFNVLFSLGVLAEARVLDVFAGSGALGLEAISRGAVSVDFVENNPKTREVIKRNAAALGVEPVKSESYELIFSDAPYDEPQWELVAKLPGLLAEGGCLVISHSKSEQIPEFVVAGLKNVYSKTFAAAQIDIFMK